MFFFFTTRSLVNTSIRVVQGNSLVQLIGLIKRKLTSLPLILTSVISESLIKHGYQEEGSTILSLLVALVRFNLFTVKGIVYTTGLVTVVYFLSAVSYKIPFLRPYAEVKASRCFLKEGLPFHPFILITQYHSFEIILRKFMLDLLLEGK